MALYRGSVKISGSGGSGLPSGGCEGQYLVMGENGPERGGSPGPNYFGDGSDGDCVIEYDSQKLGFHLMEAKPYNFNNLTICDGVKIRFCGDGVPIFKVKNNFVNNGEILLRGPLIHNGACFTEQNIGFTLESYSNCYGSTDCYTEHAKPIYDCIMGKAECLRTSAYSIDDIKNCQAEGGQAGVGYACGGKGGSLICPAENGGVYFNCSTTGGTGGTSSYDNASGGGGGGACNVSGGNGKNACDGVGGTGGAGGGCSGGGGGGYGENQGGNGGMGYSGGNGGNSLCGTGGTGGNACCNRGRAGKGGRSYYGNGGNGGVGCVYGGCGGDGGDSVCGNGGTGGYGCYAGGKGGNSIYGNGGTGGASYCGGGGAGGDSLYGCGGAGGQGYQCCGTIPAYGYGAGGFGGLKGGDGYTYGGSSIYGDGGNSCCCYYAGCSIFGNSGCAPCGCPCVSSLFGKACNRSGIGTDSCCCGDVRRGQYGFGVFAKTFTNNGTIEGRGGDSNSTYGRSNGSQIALIYSNKCSHGTISYRKGISNCNGVNPSVDGFVCEYMV